MAIIPLADVPSILSAVAAVLWPLIAAAVLIFLLPELRKVVRSRSFAVEVFGMKLSVQAASDQLAEQIRDVQQRVVALEDAAPTNGEVAWRVPEEGARGRAEL